jgi:hypothetical protein
VLSVPRDEILRSPGSSAVRYEPSEPYNVSTASTSRKIKKKHSSPSSTNWTLLPATGPSAGGGVVGEAQSGFAGEAGSESPENFESVVVNAEALSTALPPPSVHAGGAPPLVAARCAWEQPRRPSLLQTSPTAATHGCRRCYPRPLPLLQMAAAAAIHSLRRCCKRRPSLLPTAAAVAANGRRRCYYQPSIVARSGVAGAATHGRRRCCEWPPPPLPMASVVATTGRQL